jgi:hypothetical protein
MAAERNTDDELLDELALEHAADHDQALAEAVLDGAIDINDALAQLHAEPDDDQPYGGER